MSKLQRMKGMHPQVGMLLLRKCGPISLNFLAQVTPSHLTLAAFSQFDEDLANFVYNSILSLVGHAPALACSDDRLTRFKARVRLPLLFDLALIAPIAFFASAISASVEHSSLRQHFDGLSRFSSGLANQIRLRLEPLAGELFDSLLPAGSTTCLTDTLRGSLC